MPSLPSPRGKTRPRLEIIPFIDIMFFLLATFMMVSLSMIKNEGVPVNLPKAVTGQVQDRRSSAAISFTEKGDIYLDKEAVSVDLLRSRLAAMNEANPELKIFIHGDDHADFGRGVEILDEVRLLGIKKVSIQTKGRKA